MENLQVFDENKNALNKKVNREEKYDLPSGEYFMIVLIFMENEKGEFLLQKTSKSRHSCIATTGGHVSYGETPLYTIIKECKEELGIDLLANEVNYVDTIVYKNCFLETFYTKTEIDINKLVLQDEEVESVGWYSREEIADLITRNEFREGNIEPYKAILEYIRKQS